MLPPSIRTLLLGDLRQSEISQLKGLVLENGSTMDSLLARLDFIRSDPELTVQYNKRMTLFLAEYEEVIVGWALLSYYQDIADLDIFVAPTRRRKGVGRLLWSRAQEYTLKGRLKLCVTEWNHSSHNFFKTCGAKNVYTLEGYVWDSDTPELEDTQKRMKLRSPANLVL